MKITKIPGGKIFEGDEKSDSEESDRQENRGPKIVKPQIFPGPPLSPFPWSKSLSHRAYVRKRLATLEGLGLFPKNHNKK